MKRSSIGTSITFPLFIIIVFALSLFAWQRTAVLMVNTTINSTLDTNLRVGGRVGSKSEAKHVNFEDARELDLGAAASGSQPIALASADFDSDGYADVVTADSTGNLQLLKGVDPTAYAFDPALSKKQQAHPEPFTAVATDASLGFAPDQLFAGDYNADGRSDIIAAEKGAKAFAVVIGDGTGHFSQPVVFSLPGALTSIQSGEIGRPDGQTDLAVTFSNESGSYLAVYEHPESAFKHPPEIIKLPSAATSIAIGNTDEDFYSDVAVACGNDLVVVHERGQIYPWDILKDSNIRRPSAVVDLRKMSFSVSAMAIGRFGEMRGTSLALLSTDGIVYSLEPPRKISSSEKKMSSAAILNIKTVPFLPVDADQSKYATPGAGQISGQRSAGDAFDAAGNPIVDHNNLRAVGPEAFMKQRVDDLAGAKRLTPEEIAKVTADVRAKSDELNERRKAAFLASVSPRTSRMKDWTLEVLASGSRLAGAAVNGRAALTRVNVSDSDLDDLMVTAKENSEITFVSRLITANGGRTTELTSVESSSSALAVLPSRLNLDGLNDLVILQQGGDTPSVLMSAPSAVFFVNTTNDSFNCVSGGECSLRGAILAANGNPGLDTIGFALPAGSKIAPLSELPVLTASVSIQGGNLPNGTKAIEISGDQITSGPADGLKVRASNCFIWNLAINSMPNAPSGNSYIGGNGITIESTANSTNNGNNYVVGLFLGTDPSGAQARPNASTGMLVFDSDNNAIGGAGDSFRNLISGHNSGGIGLDITGGNSNTLQNNVVGLNSIGTGKLPNTIGMWITGFDNDIGGDNFGEGNTVSGNGRAYFDNPNQCGGSGIAIIGLYDTATQQLLTGNERLRGNRIGTDPNGTLPLGNCSQGVFTNPLYQTTIGSITETGRNIISDNGFGSIACADNINNISQLSQGGYCAIAGNNIGTDVTGAISLGNDDRNFPGGFYRFFGNVDLYLNLSYTYFGAPGGTTPGGPCTGFCNLYAGNWRNGALNGSNFNDDIYTTGFSTVGVFNNHIGVNRTGNQPLANYHGVITGQLWGNYFLGGIGSDNGSQISLGNVISGQKLAAVSVSAGFFNGNCAGTGTMLTVQGNKIGTDVTGSFAIPNAYDDESASIYIDRTASFLRGFADTGTLGGTDPMARNIISGNAGDAVFLGDACVSGYSVNFPLSNNLIGLNSSLSALGNGGTGITVISSFSQIGGTAETANQIAYNGTNGLSPHAGILLTRANNQFPVGVQMRGNSIHDNNGLGIDLGSTAAFGLPDGVTENDCFDGDFGPNGLQNFPSLLSTANGGTRVIGYLRSAPSQDYKLDFYSNTNAEPGTNHGEGQTYIGSLEITTNGSGFRSFEFDIPVGSSASHLVATATDSFGSTSEFSCEVGVCNDPVRQIVNSLEDVDEIYGVSICADPIIVNTTSDADDVDLLDETCDIDADTAGSQCSLRAAIEEAEHQSGANSITFDIPGGGVQTIVVGEPLPVINEQVTIDATTQPDYSGVPRVVINGLGTTNAYGLAIKASNSTVKGFSIVNFKQQLGISGGSQDRIGANYIGVFPDGTTGDMNRQQFGIALVVGAFNNQIGGARAENRNVIGGTGEGISLADNARHNVVVNNYVGVAADGFTPIPNRDGIVLRDSVQNNIGGYINERPNTISFNQENGVVLDNSTSNRVSGNFIGTTSDGSTAAGNATGVNIRNGSTNNFIGGTTFFEKNVISGQNATNNSVGVLIKPDAGVDNTVAGNYIGVSLNGDAGIPNRVGIAVNADSQYIGSSDENAYRNLIVSANTAGAYGIYLHPFYPNDELANVTVQNNTIGTLTFGETSAGEIGVYLTDNVKTCTIKGNTVGHQFFAGVRLFNGPHNNTISGNRVGIKTTGDEIPNYNGIAIRQSDTNFIKDNTVSANTNNGIVIGDSFGQNDRQPQAENGRTFGTSSFATNNVVTGNYIGTDVDASYLIPNGTVGVGVGENGRDNTIGGTGNLGNIVGGATGEYGLALFIGTINDAANVNIVPHGNKVIGNRVGVGPESNNAYLGNRYGIYVRNAVGTVVGGDTASKGNIVGNSEADGIRLFKPGTVDTTVQNNYVGVTPAGETIANGADGISVDGTGAVTLDSNTVSGNTANGIHLKNISAPARPNGSIPPPVAKAVGNILGLLKDSNGEFQKVSNGLSGFLAEDVNNVILGVVNQATNANKNIASGNEGEGIKIIRGVQVTINNSVVGTDPAGGANIGNLLDGIRLDDCTSCKIGELLKGNTIAGNGGNGINILNSENPQVEANLIGVVKEANNSIRKVQNELSGLVMSDSFNALIQNANVIAGNVGKALEATNVTDSTIRQNYIGIDDAGTDGLGNGGDGILLRDSSRNTIGGAFSDGNVICENGGNGVVINGGDANKLFRNNIGIAVQGLGSSRKANQLAGMILLNTTSNVIQDLNKISGNHAQGIVMRNAISNVVWGNLIGTDEASAQFGNDGDGILISENSSYNSIGAGGPGSGNTISYNGGAGVNIDPTAGTGNVVDPNIIFGNTGLGIDIGSPGHTPNDPNDVDEGPNRGQNYPQIVSYGINTSGELIVSYRVDTSPSNAAYPLYCEFFIADASGEGKTFLAYDYYSVSDHAGSLAGRKFINLGLAVDRGWVQGDIMTASATDADNNTSEFFPAFAPTAAGVDLSGRVADKTGRGIPNALVTLTDTHGVVRRSITNGFGYYRFDGVASGSNYILAVSQKQYDFDPPSRLVSVTDELNDIDFIGTLR